MRFIVEGTDKAGSVITAELTAQLRAGKRVIWLVCGGSNIPVEADIMTRLRAIEGLELSKLLVLPMDERYGKPGHADSNYKQLQDAGFEAGDAFWVDVLAKGQPLEETVAYYDSLVQTSFASADHIVGVFGLGADGHTAGVKPGSPALVDDMASVVGFKWDDFTRMTLTPRELIRSDSAFLLAYGDAKKPMLEHLRQGDAPITEVPANLLHKIADVAVFNDQIGDKE